jgi:hypothetical protein
MNKPIDEASAIFSEKGDGLMQADLDAMEELFTQIPPEQWDDVLMLMEGVALVVNDPSYKGDIAPIV